MSTSEEKAVAEREAMSEVLGVEYALLVSALSAAWSASLVRTSIFLISLSAAGVALGFVAQGGLDSAPFRTLALVILPLVLFLGIATFVRLVQVQRESVVYNMGLNRIRHFFQETAPASRRYFVLPAYDDDTALYRSVGTGMRRRPPRSRLLYLAVQTQGIVGVVTAAVAAAAGALAVSAAGPVTTTLVAVVAFAVTLGALFAYWQRSLAELRGAINSLFPTPAEEADAPF
ncbi:MAG TPA: hypothetical protein VIQ02_14710 [Jiangellaceae bacterium]